MRRLHLTSPMCSIDCVAEPGTALTPEMTDAEIGVIRACSSKAIGLVELGNGGSTLMAVRSPSLR